MARNRTLWNILSVIIGAGVIAGTVYLSNYMNRIYIGIIGVFIGACMIGFFAYKDDGVKIAIVFGLGTFILALVVGILIFGGFQELLNNSEGLEAIGAAIGGILIIVVIIIVVVGSIVISIIMVLGSVIGRAIGKNVWKDAKKETLNSGQGYRVANQKSYTTYQQNEIKCQKCGKINPGNTSFCSNCGAQIETPK